MRKTDFMVNAKTRQDQIVQGIILLYDFTYYFFVIFK